MLRLCFVSGKEQKIGSRKAAMVGFWGWVGMNDVDAAGWAGLILEEVAAA